MKGLITDRSYDNVLRRAELTKKGWANMTEAERAEWLGDPLAATGANLFRHPFAYGDYYSGTVALSHIDDSISASVYNAGSNGKYLFAVMILGDAANFEGKTFTMSIDRIESSPGSSPMIELYWHDDSGAEPAGAWLTEAGSVTFNIDENAGNRMYLAAYIYVTTDSAVESGAFARFYGVMLENGSVRHEYVPYTEILATPTTKGAYNYSDLNRVESAVAEFQKATGLSSLDPKIERWQMWDVPTRTDMERYINNVKKIRKAFLSEDIPLPNGMDFLNYENANQIEEVLSKAWATIKNASLHSGEIFCGEV